MHRVQVESWGEAPKYQTVDDLPAPGPDELQLRVLAAGLHNVVRSRAAGKHYSASILPHIPGVDAVAKDESTGQLYYVSKMTPAFGTMADYINIEKANATPLPAHVDPVKFAASYNPTMSSWLALTQRTENLPKDFSVLIIGATSASGRMAVNVARTLGAGKIVGMGRNAESLAKVDGLDSYIIQAEDVSKTDMSSLDADVVLDYVYGDIVIQVLKSVKPGKPVQYVQIGGLAQVEVALPSALLRSKPITLRGSGPGGWTMKGAQTELPKIVAAMADWKLLDAEVISMKDVETAWNDKSLGRKGRLVVQP